MSGAIAVRSILALRGKVSIGVTVADMIAPICRRGLRGRLDGDE
jgi:hypothetical protein